MSGTAIIIPADTEILLNPESIMILRKIMESSLNINYTGFSPM